MTGIKELDIAESFTAYPVGRFRSDGRYSGQAFREDYLGPALRNGAIAVVMDGAMGYGSSFLEEAFGGLVRECGFEPKDLKRNLTIQTADPLLLTEIWSYIEEAGQPEMLSARDA